MGLKSYFFIGLYFFESFVFAGVWQTEDQKAFQYYKKQDFEHAYHLFENKRWKAAAAYKTKNYQAAIQLYKKARSADDFYNLANSLALLGDYPNSVKAYKKALDLDANHQDAKFNLEIIEKLLQKKQDKKSQSNKEETKQQQQQTKDKSQPSTSDSQNNQSKNKEKENQAPQPEESKNNNESSTNKNKDNQNQETKSTQQAKHSKSENATDKEFSEWLKLIENDPQGLLRQKFLRDYQRDLEEHKS